jgi:hypothetical protein
MPRRESVNKAIRFFRILFNFLTSKNGNISGVYAREELAISADENIGFIRSGNQTGRIRFLNR